MDNVATVNGAYEAFGRGDIAAVIDLLADDVEWSSPLTLPHGGQFKGKDGVGQFFQGIGGLWAGLQLEVHGVSALDGDSVVGVVTARGELSSGGAAGYGAAHVFTFANGKVVRFREYVDLDKPLT
jgi:ketosteroid isomerase-like protein